MTGVYFVRMFTPWSAPSCRSMNTHMAGFKVLHDTTFRATLTVSSSACSIINQVSAKTLRVEERHLFVTSQSARIPNSYIQQLGVGSAVAAT